ncbi:hypothetical protein BO94DRAFT_581162 [Aspergillus sclerotioniger CBS 115572]|uniref:Uncharacterized protein n=1 Tax=Aspergillus sclerotioniger CBS 115572 TaxID=1450535 RepID=A0A317XEE7_9EURO|nr:hypothetical protein BO94DRAFT_581162 [Aspergillus sclerotioniger CBS 115572]PWY96017.1 hypothetical protein BO94DRAFT_581162 [Aspergillus sclerotioniger CBS 115572]
MSPAFPGPGGNNNNGNGNGNNTGANQLNAELADEVTTTIAYNQLKPDKIGFFWPDLRSGCHSLRTNHVKISPLASSLNNSMAKSTCGKTSQMNAPEVVIENRWQNRPYQNNQGQGPRPGQLLLSDRLYNANNWHTDRYNSRIPWNRNRNNNQQAYIATTDPTTPNEDQTVYDDTAFTADPQDESSQAPDMYAQSNTYDDAPYNDDYAYYSDQNDTQGHDNNDYDDIYAFEVQPGDIAKPDDKVVGETTRSVVLPTAVVSDNDVVEALSQM